MSTTLNGKDPSLGPGFFHHGSGGKIYLHIRSFFVYQTASCPLKTQKKQKPTCRLPCNTQVTLPRTNSLRTHGKGKSSCSHLLLVRWVGKQDVPKPFYSMSSAPTTRHSNQPPLKLEWRKVENNAFLVFPKLVFDAL